MFQDCIVMSYVLRVVSLMYSNVVESKMTKRLRVYICIMNYILYVYEVKFLAYEVQWKFLTFTLNLLCQCDEWYLWACIRPPRGQVRHVISRGCSPSVTNVVSELEVLKSGLVSKNYHIATSSGFFYHWWWVKTHQMVRESIGQYSFPSSSLSYRAIELNSLSLSFIFLSGGI